MKSFLEHVARHILDKYGHDLSRLAVVFPNKRASLFLNEHLARLSGGEPLWSPAYITISDLFRRHSTLQVADPVQLVCLLHRSFTAVTGTDETLDHFYGWGQLLLADFDDIDKQMADADRVFANLSDLHEMDDDSFLTDEQRQVLQRFFTHFSADHNTELKQRFLRLWNRMGAIYHDFNQRLAQRGLAYEGAIYRQVAESHDDLQLPYDTYLFVGFNVLLRAEQQLFTHIMRQGKARFYWDFDRYYMRSGEAGHFISQYLQSFPNELDTSDASIYDCFSCPRRLNIVAASTENIQARYAAQWLQQDEQRTADGRRTAIVLCNEALLPTIIHCIPPAVQSVNITTGYPLAQSPIATLVSQLIALRRDGYDHQRGHYRLRQVLAVLRHPYLAALSPQVSVLAMELTEQRYYYPTPDLLSQGGDVAALLFPPVPAEHQNAALLSWLCQVVQTIGRAQQPSATGTTTPGPDPLKQESVFRTYTLLNRLLNLAEAGELVTDIITLGHLITQLMQTTTVPFHGEPVEGLQVMGILETRNLDFTHLLILSAQEGNMPRGTTDTSFIPYALRRAYGLTTPEHKVAIYSYYFHRLLQRATDITIVWNNATTDGQRGEMSRFLLQLMVESPHPVTHYTLQGGQQLTSRSPQPVPNHATPPQLLTPTAINRYLRCPLQFHYRYVCGLQEPDPAADDDSIDNRLFGNIFHDAAQALYTRLQQAGGPDAPVTAAHIRSLLRQPDVIARAVDQAFAQQLFAGRQTSSLHTRLNGLQIINRQVIMHYLHTLLEGDCQLAPFHIMGLEDEVSMPLDVGPDLTINVGGRIDRLDCVSTPDGCSTIRVIDYKTGAHRMKALPDVDAVFRQESLKEHSDYYLQAMLYSVIVARQHPAQAVSPALLFIQHAAAPGYNPVLHFGQQPISDIRSVEEPFLQQLRNVVSDMFNPDVPLTPTADTQRCRNCPYRQLCY